MYSRRPASQDAVSDLRFGRPGILSPVGALVFRTFEPGNGISAGNIDKILDGSPTLAVLSSPEDTPESWMQTGRALSRVLLAVVANGASASYLNPPVELAQLRPKLRSTVGRIGIPKLLMRSGYGPILKPRVCR